MLQTIEIICKSQNLKVVTIFRLSIEYDLERKRRNRIQTLDPLLKKRKKQIM